MQRFILRDFTEMVKAKGGSIDTRYMGNSPYSPGTLIVFPGEATSLSSKAGLRLRVKRLDVELTTIDPNTAYKGRVGVLDVYAVVAAQDGEWVVATAEEEKAAKAKGDENLIVTRGGYTFVKVEIREERNAEMGKIISEAFGGGFLDGLGNPFEGLVLPSDN